MRAKSVAEATADPRLDHGASADQVHYNLALVHLEQQDRAGALASLRRALQVNPSHREALDLAQRLGP